MRRSPVYAVADVDQEIECVILMVDDVRRKVVINRRKVSEH
jgi:hypothetical protein